MESIFWLGVGSGCALLLTLLVLAWWRQRAAMVEMQRRLAWNEQSRFDLEYQTQDLNLRLESMAHTLESLKTQKPLERNSAPKPTVQTVQTVKAHVDSAASYAALNKVWKETEPTPMHASDFAHTIPFDPNADEITAVNTPVRR